MCVPTPMHRKKWHHDVVVSILKKIYSKDVIRVIFKDGMEITV
jgi:hypothetical protein